MSGSFAPVGMTEIRGLDEAATRIRSPLPTIAKRCRSRRADEPSWDRTRIALLWPRGVVPTTSYTRPTVRGVGGADIPGIVKAVTRLGYVVLPTRWLRGNGGRNSQPKPQRRASGMGRNGKE